MQTDTLSVASPPKAWFKCLLSAIATFAVATLVVSAGYQWIAAGYDRFRQSSVEFVFQAPLFSASFAVVAVAVITVMIHTRKWLAPSLFLLLFAFVYPTSSKLQAVGHDVVEGIQPLLNLRAWIGPAVVVVALIMLAVLELINAENRRYRPQLAEVQG